VRAYDGAPDALSTRLRRNGASGMWLAWLGKASPATNGRSASPPRCGRTCAAARPRRGRKRLPPEKIPSAATVAVTDMRQAEAQFERGMALLADPQAAGEWRQAVALIEEAAAAGHPGAGERCALFECMGAGRVPDWRKGLDWLARAAERGSAAAARQLILLAEDRFEPEGAQPRTAGSWTELAARVPLEQRLRAPAGRTLSPRPLIRALDAFASPAECRWLIEAATPRLDRAMVYDSTTNSHGSDPRRTNRGAQFQFVDLDVVVEMVRTRISSAIGAPPPFLEVSQVLHYSVGEEFRPHFDFLDPGSATYERDGQRAATVLIYLNEDFDGGETRFPLLDLSYRGKTGDALIFANVDPSGQPDRSTLHAGVPPTRGEKWLFSQWVRDRPLGL
jgi:prolyl 4-hydroxylase